MPHINICPLCNPKERSGNIASGTQFPYERTCLVFSKDIGIVRYLLLCSKYYGKGLPTAFNITEACISGDKENISKNTVVLCGFNADDELNTMKFVSSYFPKTKVLTESEYSESQ